ncbi:MAG: GAP family protein [Patescibacteria group bacterium]|nr:GAP family protein [Patescibacteria group bacterium]MDD5221742.1 GAP family protein [Patescibacteria group bacterium]MDD5395769.1 GAP family protein [Patescibacteria group bacterium]
MNLQILNIPTVVGAAAIDSINPCAFAVLIFLLSYLTLIGSPRRTFRIGLIYILTVFVVYFLAGLGILQIFTTFKIGSLITKVAAGLLILMGLVNLKDFFWYGRGFTLAIPKSKKPIIEKYIHQASIPGAVILGFLVSAFELPCTGGIYLGVLCLLAESCSRGKGVLYLLLYNFVFILPLLLILLLVNFGLSSEKLEVWRQKNRHWMKLAAGLFLVGLAILLLLA